MRLLDGSGMSREVHVPFCERLRVRLPRPTHLTYCASTLRGQYFYLYLIEDIYSRKIVGWEVHEQESGAMAAELLQRSVIREECFKRKRSFQHILPAPQFPL